MSILTQNSEYLEEKNSTAVSAQKRIVYLQKVCRNVPYSCVLSRTHDNQHFPTKHATEITRCLITGASVHKSCQPVDYLLHALTLWHFSGYPSGRQFYFFFF